MLFGLLIAFTSRWTVFEAQSLRDNPDNRRQLLEEARIKRGLIKARSGEVLARSVPAPGNSFRRTYPTDELFAAVIGYAFTDLGRAGTEQERNAPLTGENGELSSVLDQLTGRRPEGDNLVTALDPAAQRAALTALGDQRGAVVALEPATGRVRVMVSSPGFDPNGLPQRFRKLSQAKDSPLLNRATQGGYPPGSTFKVVTAVAALDSGLFTPDSLVNGDSGKVISTVPLNNFGDKDFGQITLTTALTNSVNTVWAEVGVRLGKTVMGRYMKRFGFYAKPPIDYPARQRIASGEYREGRLLSPESSFIDVGRMAIGQDKLAVTPLQMAMVAAAVANGGKLMKPRIGERVVDLDGRVADSIEPEVDDQVMKPSTAAVMTEMMKNVVREGTGTAAALQGIEVAGKTGTAEIVPGQINQPWFIGFAPADNPSVAIAVTVERSTGQGGTVAAPIAKKVLEALL